MKKRKFADGGETTEMEPSAKPEGGRFDEDTYSRARRFVESSKTATNPTAKKAPTLTPKAAAPAPAPAPKAAEPEVQRVEVTGKKPSKDDTTKSLSERMKASRERSRTSNTGTDTRSVSERIKGALGFSKGGATKKYAAGGSVGSASRRADGIATKGKTKCRIV
jgi:hypothetical protein